jgi:hypothetical protein
MLEDTLMTIFTAVDDVYCTRYKYSRQPPKEHPYTSNDIEGLAVPVTDSNSTSTGASVYAQHPY